MRSLAREVCSVCGKLWFPEVMERPCQHTTEDIAASTEELQKSLRDGVEASISFASQLRGRPLDPAEHANNVLIQRARELAALPSYGQLTQEYVKLVLLELAKRLDSARSRSTITN